MTKTLLIPLLIGLAFLPGLRAFGQVKFTTSTHSQEIGLSDFLQVSYLIENAKSIDQFTLPDFPGFRVIQGPSQSSQTTIINGQMSQSNGVTLLLQPEKTGKLTIPGATVMADGRKMQSNTVSITVIPGSAGNASGGKTPSGGNGGLPGAGMFPGSNMGGGMGNFWADPFSRASSDIEREYYLKPGEDVDEKIRKNLFVKVQADKTTCYVGEPIIASYKLYSRLRSESRVSKFPYLNGFSVYDMINPNNDITGIEKVNGKSFAVHTLRKAQLIPLQSGKIELDPLEMDNTVEFIKGDGTPHRSHGDPFEDFFDPMPTAGGPPVEEHVSLATKPLDITVLPLPDKHKPANFNGAVGQFTITDELSGSNIMAQDEAHLKVILKGSGNLPVINAPQVQWPAGIQSFDPTARTDIDKNAIPLIGTKTFDFLFTTDRSGHYTIPPLSFSYFDPKARDYRTIQTNAIDFQVSPAVKSKHPATGYASTQPARSHDMGLWPSLTGFVQGHLESIFAIIILSGIAFFLWRQNIRLKRSEEQKQEAGHRDNRAALTATAGRTVVIHPADPLKEARQRLEQGDYPGFYRDLNRAVWKAVAEKVDLPASELNKYNVLRQLEVRGWDTSTLLSLEHLLNECEMNLYTPSFDTYNMQQLLRQAESLFGVFVADASY